jgi:hypothetical protein
MNKILNVIIVRNNLDKFFHHSLFSSMKYLIKILLLFILLEQNYAKEAYEKMNNIYEL